MRWAVERRTVFMTLSMVMRTTQRGRPQVWNGGQPPSCIPGLRATLPRKCGIPASRVVRGAVIGVKENVLLPGGAGDRQLALRSMLRHVLPNIAAPLIVIFSINVGGVIIAEASLSFLGFGLPANIPSWGGMLSREGRQYMEIAPRLALWPGLCLTVTVYALNLFGDAVIGALL